MKDYLFYLIEANVYLLVLYLVYAVGLRRETFFRLNRVYLITALLLAFLAPLLHFSFTAYVPAVVQGIQLDTIQVTQTIFTNEQQQVGFWTILGMIYGIGVFWALLRFGHSLFHIGRLIRSGQKTQHTDYTLIAHQNALPVFSFWRYLFWDPNEKAELEPDILKHELAHIQQWHTLDVLLVELLGMVCWWIPVHLLYKRAIQQVHEYLADEAVTHTSTNHTAYMTLLVSEAIGAPGLSLSQSFFNPSLLKNRITMMNKQPSQPSALLKYAAALPLLAMAFYLTACVKSPDQAIPSATAATTATDAATTSNQVYDKVEQMPEYPGGMSALINDMSAAIKLPESEKDSMMEGKNFIGFVVNAAGKVEQVTVEKSLDPLYDSVSVAAVKSLADWTPGKQDGKAVSVKMVLPVMYTNN